MSPVQILNTQFQKLRYPEQTLMTGTVGPAGFAGQYSLSVGGITYTADNGLDFRLLEGDRVLVAMGRGNPRILGLLGPDRSDVP